MGFIFTTLQPILHAIHFIGAWCLQQTLLLNIFIYEIHEKWNSCNGFDRNIKYSFHAQKSTGKNCNFNHTNMMSA